MARKTFLWYLFSKNKKPYYVNDVGVVVEGTEDWLKASGQPAHLETSPRGWLDTLVKYARNIEYWGLNRDMTFGMLFGRDGYKIMKHVYNTLGYDGVVFIGVLKLNRLDTPYKYESWYLSELNLVKYQEMKAEIKGEALEGGMSKIVKAFENQVYTIPITGTKVKRVLMDGIQLEGRYNYIIGEWVMDPYSGDGSLYNFNPLVIRDSTEGNSAGIDFRDSNYMQSIGTTVSNEFLVMKPEQLTSLTVHITGVLKLRMNVLRDNEHFGFGIMRANTIFNPPPAVTQQHWIFFPPLGFGSFYTFQGETRDIPIDLTLTLAPQDSLCFYMEIGQGTNTGRPCGWEILPDSVVHVEFSNKFKETYTVGYYAMDLFELIVKEMIKDQFLLPTVDGLFHSSDWLAMKKDIIITSQDALRELEAPVIKTSFKQFFRSMRHWGAASGITPGGKLFIELLTSVFKDDIIIDLGEVSKASYAVAEDLLFNSIRVGGPEVEYDDVNGRYEWNQEQLWQAPVTKFTKEYDLVSDYRKDCYGAEFARVLRGMDTTDDRSDNDVWMLSVESGEQVDANGLTYFKLLRRPYTLLEGVPASTFNHELSPHRTILNNGFMLNSILGAAKQAEQITMTSAVKNAELHTVIGGEDILEKAPITVSSLSAPKFSHNYITFETQVPVNLLPLMDANPYGKVKFQVNGRDYFGFLMDGGIKPAMNDKQQWKVLSCIENDLSKFYEPL